jgi:hypothetical protein
MKDSKTKPEESTRLGYTRFRHSYCHTYILRYVSFTEVGSVFRVASREPMHLCTCVSEEGDDGEALRLCVTFVPPTYSINLFINLLSPFSEESKPKTPF